MSNAEQSEIPPYLDRIDELEKVDIARLKGNIDKDMVPIIEARIQMNRKREGIKLDKNIIVDYKNVDNVDTSTIAFNLVRLKELEAHGKRVGFINVTKDLKVLLDMFKQNENFHIYPTEEEAVNELNR